MEAQYGIARLSVIPLYEQRSNGSIMSSQLLYGEHYTVLSSSAEWYRIQNASDDHTGWMHSRQHSPIDLRYFDDLSNRDLQVVTAVAGTLRVNDEHFLLSMGSILPYIEEEMFHASTYQFDGETKKVGVKTGFSTIEEVGLQLLNIPHLQGGKTAFGMDGSGFTQQLFKMAGYQIGRSMEKQQGQGKAIRDLKEIVPGSLLFFGENFAEHTGVLLTNDKVLHVADKVRIDILDAQKRMSVNGKTLHLFSARKILKTE